MKLSLESKRAYLLATVLGAFLALSFTATPVFAQQVSSAVGNSRAITISTPGQVINETAFGNSTTAFSIIGAGGNDTFNLFGGNATTLMAATGIGNNNFSIITGNPTMGTNSSTFSLLSGANSTFTIVQNNFNGTVVFQIIGGTHCLVNATSEGAVSSTVFSVVLGANSTADIASQLTGNETAINIIS